MKKKQARMDTGFAVFNLHVNKAGKKADAEFIKQFGQLTFDKHIAPRHKEGIMSIFRKKQNVYTASWVTLVTAYVNENRE